MRKYLLAAALLGALASPSHAVLLGDAGFEWDASNAAILTLSDAVPAGNQVKNLPCIICGANQPQQPTGFGYNLFGNTGNADTVSFFSTAVVPGGGGSGLAIDQFSGATGYSIGDGSVFKAALAGNLTFSIGLDVNDTNTPQTLESFWFLNLTQKTVLGVYSPGPGGALIPDINNGTGFPDYTISGLSLAGINQGDQIMFFARITGANDGPDSFFLQAVPGPVVGAGLPGLMAACFALWGFARNRRRRNDPVVA